MTSNLFVLFLTCFFAGIHPKLSSSVQQKEDFLYVYVGGNVTLKCSYEDQTLKQIFWYKQKNKNNLLKFTYLKISDSATYHCISSDSYSITFLESYSLIVKDPSSYIQTSVDQSSSENIHAGDSVTLNCTVHTGSCDGEHRVYWFKDSEDSHPGLIYTHGGRKDQCERNKNTQTHSCVYNLPMKNLTESHAGIYYCAVASCGHILFGNRIKLDFAVTTIVALTCAKMFLIGSNISLEYNCAHVPKKLCPIVTNVSMCHTVD
uniref:Ig-like domain-containing protein n=1 Tax=Oryzias melastigma TaxID=30732 RepID=A0A3B3BNR6_ORYME